MRPADETKFHLFNARAEVAQRAHKRMKGQRCAAPFPIYRDPAGELLAAHASVEASNATVAHIEWDHAREKLIRARLDETSAKLRIRAQGSAS